MAAAAEQLQQALSAATSSAETASEALPEAVVIAEADGVMVPMVNTTVPPEKAPFSSDRRRHRSVLWKEAKTAAISISSDAGNWRYAASFGDADALVKGGALAAAAVGYQPGMQVHVLADGATWIQEWGEDVFGSDARQTVDLYHLLEYAAAAGHEIDPNSMAWVDSLSTWCRNGSAEEAAAELKRSTFYTPNNQDSAVLKFVRYIENRPNQFNYPTLREAGLPVGSGKIESTNRQLVQKRMKLPGAWWHSSSVPPVLNLLVTWYNGQWKDLWAARPQAAA